MLASMLPWAIALCLSLLCLPLTRASISSLQLSPPAQCEPIVFAWTRDSTPAQAPDSYVLVIVPVDSQTAGIRNYTFETTSNRYVLPELSQPFGLDIVALLYDSDGPDRGRVSDIVHVDIPASDARRCLGLEDLTPDAFFWFEPGPTPTKCGTGFGWTANATGPIGIIGLLPGGRSFDVPITNASIWRTFSPFQIAPGSRVMFAASGGTGEGKSGTLGFSKLYNVSENATSCSRGGPIYSKPASTSITYATLTDEIPRPTLKAASSGGGGHLQAILAGVLASLGGLVVLIGLGWFCLRRRARRRLLFQSANGEPILAEPEMSETLRPTPFAPDVARPSLDTSGAVSPLGPNRTVSDERPTPSKRTSNVGSDDDSTRSPRSDPGESPTGQSFASARERPGRSNSRHYSRTRFVDHEDAGVAERAEGATEEGVFVVEVPPRYQDARVEERPRAVPNDVSASAEDSSESPSAAASTSSVQHGHSF